MEALEESVEGWVRIVGLIGVAVVEGLMVVSAPREAAVETESANARASGESAGTSLSSLSVFKRR